MDIVKIKSRAHLTGGALFVGLAVALGAIGAHALKQHLDPKALETFNTGVRYQLYHGFGLLILGVMGAIRKRPYRAVGLLFTAGILLFSLNCYIYAITGIKFFVMLVPLGGISFIAGWLWLTWNIHSETSRDLDHHP